MLKIAMRMVRDALRAAGIVGKNVGLVACVHDEIVIEVPEDRAEEAQIILKTCMRQAGEVYLHAIPVVTETACADYWVK
jgi:twinkle protein